MARPENYPCRFQKLSRADKTESESMGRFITAAAIDKWIEIVPSLLWVAFGIVLFCLFYKQIRNDILPKLTGFKVMGAEMSFVKNSIDAAVEFGAKWHVAVSEKDKAAALQRAKRNIDVFKNARILWIDDLPKNNRHECRMFRQLQASVENVTNSQRAFELLEIDVYDLVISDIARDDEGDAGIKFLNTFREQDKETPLIFYIGNYVPKDGVPKQAFGITDRPDELLHLVVDVLERKK